MRVLKGYVLVVVQSNSNNGSDLVPSSVQSRGSVHLSGSTQISTGEEVLFGDDFEEIVIGPKGSSKYLLMKEDNVKIIYEPDPSTPSSQSVQTILPFLQKKTA